MEAVVRSEVMDALVGFMCTNTRMTEITDIDAVPNESELSEFPALRLRITEEAPPRFFLENVAVVE